MKKKGLMKKTGGLMLPKGKKMSKHTHMGSKKRHGK